MCFNEGKKQLLKVFSLQAACLKYCFCNVSEGVGTLTCPAGAGGWGFGPSEQVAFKSKCFGCKHKALFSSNLKQLFIDN